MPAKDIYITLGSQGVPADIIDDFIIHLFGDPCEHLYGYYDADQIRETWKTIHDEITGTWELVRELSGLNIALSVIMNGSVEEKSQSRISICYLT